MAGRLRVLRKRPSVETETGPGSKKKPAAKKPKKDKPETKDNDETKATNGEAKAETPKKVVKSSKRSKKIIKNGTEQFDVEEVRGVKVQDDLTFYFVKWSGYPEKDNSWEPSGNMRCKDKVTEYLTNALNGLKTKK